MSGWDLAAGYFVSLVVGYFITWVLIDIWAWRYAGQSKGARSLSKPLGIVDRFLFTTAFMAGEPVWIVAWLVIKIAVKWRGWQGPERAPYNIFLIGSGLNVILSFIGVWVAAGEIPI